MHARCTGYALLGALAGCGVSYAQDPDTTAALVQDPTLGQLVMALVHSGGWPSVLGFLGWLVGSGKWTLPAIRIVVEQPPPKAG